MSRLSAALLMAGLTTGITAASLSAQDAAPDTNAPIATERSAPEESATPTGKATQEAEPAQEPAADTSAPSPAEPSESTAPTPAPQASNQIPTSREDATPGQNYIMDTFSDWTLRCVRIEEIEDPCELHQTLEDQNGTRTAEINLFPLDRPGIAAGATIVTPLETLLTRNITLSVDGGDAKAYPFTFCNRVGCVSQVAFTDGEIAIFKRGSAGKLVIVPVAAPDQTVELTVSLAGFTAAYEKLTSMPQP